MAPLLSDASRPADHLTARDFDRIARFLHGATGINISASKRTMLEGRLKRRAAALRLDSVAQYCERFFASDAAEPERTCLINAVTTNKTDFFREPAHFEHLLRRHLPVLAAAGTTRLRVWSAACSTGAEPYTLAMVLEQARRQGGPQWEVLATDLDTEVLAVARRGVYPADLIGPVPPAYRDYLHHSRQPGRNEVRVVPELRARVTFAQMNLMEARYKPGHQMDVIFCRNVLIYFDKPTQAAVVTRLAGCLTDPGRLYLGHSESINGLGLPLTAVGNTVFQRS